MRIIIDFLITIFINIHVIIANPYNNNKTNHLHSDKTMKNNNPNHNNHKISNNNNNCFQYRFSSNIHNPCLNYTCAFQAWCIPSIDFKRPTCICYNTCYDVGDSIDKGPICGTDNRDYESICHLRREACTMMIDLSIKYRGSCGKLIIYIYLLH